MIAKHNVLEETEQVLSIILAVTAPPAGGSVYQTQLNYTLFVLFCFFNWLFSSISTSSIPAFTEGRAQQVFMMMSVYIPVAVS